jgi:diguanylate cyclase (GGDEF)-like protein/PAS domain S-box-containing protein
MIDPELLQQALEASGDGFVITDAREPDNPIIYVNPAFERMTGYPPDEVLGRNCRFLQGDDTRQEALEELRAALREGRACRVTLRNYRKDGRLFWNELGISPVRDESGELTHFIGVQKDVTRRVVAESRLRASQHELEEANRKLGHLATHDPLTGLRNRRYFEDRLEEEWGRARREGAPLSLFLVDLDHFKQYNDHYGHPAGDRALRTVAAALEETFQRASDLMARYGGEEFIAIATGLEEDGARELGESLRRRIARLQVEHAASPVAAHLTVSVGIVTCRPGEEVSTEDAIRMADEALYRAKTAGRNRVESASGETG